MTVARCTFPTVRENSRPIFESISKAQAVAVISAARQWAAGAERAEGRRWGPITPIDVSVLEVLIFKAMTWRTGQLDWSYNQICKATRRCKQSVCDSLKRLKAAGFLDWTRRYERTDAGGAKGVQVLQTTNAYRISFPERVRAWIAARLQKRNGPPPDDLDHARQAHAKAALYYEMCDRSPALADSLDGLERAVQERESRNPTTLPGMDSN